MSRTNKDKPIHARAEWWEPDHWGCGNGISRHWAWRGFPRRECDLPADPDPASYDRTARFGGRQSWRCQWLPVWDRRRFTNYVFHNPQRRVLRDYGHRAIAEYRGSGEVDTIEPDGRARHSAGWDYW